MKLCVDLCFPAAIVFDTFCFIAFTRKEIWNGLSLDMLPITLKREGKITEEIRNKMDLATPGHSVDVLAQLSGLLTSLNGNFKSFPE